LPPSTSPAASPPLTRKQSAPPVKLPSTSHPAASHPILAIAQGSPERRRSWPPVRKLAGDDETLDHPGEHLSASITAVGSRSNAPE
jgi:hypothetical protein